MAETPMQPMTLQGLDDKAIFDQAMAGGLPASGEPPPPEPTPTPEPEPKPAEPSPAPVGEPGTPPQPAAAVPPGPPPEHIPAWRLKEEADARREAESRASLMEARLTQILQHLQQSQQAPKPTDFFDDPQAVTRNLINQTLQAQLTPFMEENRRNTLYLSKMVAGTVHGADKVETAEQTFLDSMKAGVLDPADYERVVTAPNRYDAVVQWHKRHTTLAAVGDDPNAWFEKQLEAKLADPAFAGKLLEKVRGGAAGAQPNGAGPVSLPPTLSKLTSTAPASTANGGDPLSEAALWNFAMAPEPPRPRGR